MKYLMYFLGVFLTISLGNGEMGIADISPKIVGGSNARLEDFPYMASLRDRNNWFTCGAVIIGTNWGMSAAHCTWGRHPTNVFLVAGSINRFQGGVSFPLSNIHYINYNPATRENDICLLRTTLQIGSTGAIRPISLNFDHIGAGVDGKVSGWGSTIQGPGQPSTFLQWLNKTTISNDDCKAALNPSLPNYFPVIPSFLCTRGQIGSGFCFGDSGGPLASNGKLIGIVSWAIPCAFGHPDVYIRISPYREWITNLIRS